MKLEHGINRIWDMELYEVNNILLKDMYEDTSIEVLKQFGSEDLFPYLWITKIDDDKWIGRTNRPLVELPKEIVDRELNIIKEVYDDYIDLVRHDEVEVIVRVNPNSTIEEAISSIEYKADMVWNDLASLKKGQVSKLAYSYISMKRPVYHRAMEKVKLELENFITDDVGNEKKIVEICGRVKELSSICEKIKRKGINQYEAVNSFNDIAGVRCTCEYLDDVYDVLNYIKNNPMFDVLEIDDKIENPTQEGYRGIHVIVSTSVYYQGNTYDGVKVEIQLRTAFQNAWSMKTHQLTYKKDSIESKEIKEVLKKLSDVLKEADETALEMKKINEKD